MSLSQSEIEKILSLDLSRLSPDQPASVGVLKQPESLDRGEMDFSRPKSFKSPLTEDASPDYYYNNYYKPFPIVGESPEDYAAREKKIKDSLLNATAYTTEEPADTGAFFGNRSAVYLVNPTTNEPVFNTVEDIAKELVTKGATRLIRGDFIGPEDFRNRVETTLPVLEYLRTRKQALEAERRGDIREAGPTAIPEAMTKFVAGPKAEGVADFINRRFPDVFLGPKAQAGKMIELMENEFKDVGINPYLLREIGIAEETGVLDAQKAVLRTKEAITFGPELLEGAITNGFSLAAGIYDFFTSPNGDYRVYDENGDPRIDYLKFDSAAETLSQSANIPLELATALIATSPTLIDRTAGVAPSVVSDLALVGGGRIALAYNGMRKFKKFLQKTYKVNTLEEAAKLGIPAKDVMNRYFGQVGGFANLSFLPSKLGKALDRFARVSRARDIDIMGQVSVQTGRLGRGALKGKSAVEVALSSKQKKLNKIIRDSQEELDKLKDTAETVTRRTALEQKIARSTKELDSIRAEINLPPYLQSLAREFPAQAIGIGTFAQIVQDGIGTNDPATSLTLQLSEAGGAVAAALAPATMQKGGLSIIGAPLLVPVAVLKLGKTALVDSEKVLPKAAQDWVSVLRTLEPEQYDQAVDAIDTAVANQDKLRQIIDPTTGERLLTDDDVTLTVAELINQPLLRIHQQTIREQISLGDISSFNDIAMALGNSLINERQSLDNLSLAITKLNRANLSGADEQFRVDLNAIYKALDSELNFKLNELEAGIDSAEADLFQDIMGRVILENGEFVVPDFRQITDQIDTQRRLINTARGLDKDEILDAQQKVLQDRLNVIKALAVKSRINRDPTISSQTLASQHIITLHQLKMTKFEESYEELDTMYSGAMMDASNLADEFIDQGVPENTSNSVLAGDIPETNSPVKIDIDPEGKTIPTKSLNTLQTVFGGAATRELEYLNDVLGEVAFSAIVKASKARNKKSFVQWSKVRSYLRTPEGQEAIAELIPASEVTPEVIKQIADRMSLPINFAEYRRIISHLGEQAYAKTRGSRGFLRAQSTRNVRDNFISESQGENGFVTDYRNIGADGTRQGTPLGKEANKALTGINNAYIDEVLTPLHSPIASKVLYDSQGRKVGSALDSAKYTPENTPSKLFDRVFATFINLRKDGDVDPTQFYELIEAPLALALGGRRIIPRGALDDKEVIDSSTRLDISRFTAPSGTAKEIKEQTESLNTVRNLFISYLNEQVDLLKGFDDFLEGADLADFPPKLRDYINQRLESIDVGDTGKTKMDALGEEVEAKTKDLVEFIERIGNIKIYDVDPQTSAIKEVESLINLNEIGLLHSFNALSDVNKKASEAGDQVRKVLKEGAEKLKQEVNTEFSFENLSAIAARDFAKAGANINKDVDPESLYNLIREENALETIASLRQSYINTIKTRAKIKNKELSEEFVGDIFDNHLRYLLGKYIDDETTVLAPGQIFESTTDGISQRTAREVDLNKLQKLLGDDSPGATETDRIVAENLKTILRDPTKKDLPLGEDSHYTSMKAIVDYLVRKNTSFNSVNLVGEARSLSIESWLSRIYSISRGVVSTRYVLSEFLIQHSRVKGQKLFVESMRDPILADQIARMIKTGEVPQGADQRAFSEAMVSAILRGIRDTASPEEIQELEEQGAFTDEAREEKINALATQMSDILDNPSPGV